MDPAIVRTLLTVLFGAIAGGVTNAIAVWMLFHPYEPPVIFGRRWRFLQGAIPKNKARLATAMGRTVGQKLLTPEDITRSLSEPGFRTAFDERLTAFLDDVFRAERGTLNEVLPPELRAEVHAALVQVADGLLVRLDGLLDSDDFRARAAGWATSLADEIRDQPIGTVLTAEREAALAEAADRWISDAVEARGFERAVNDYLERASHRLLRPGRTFQELLPEGLVAAVERAIAGYLPIALERLGGLLDDPAAKARVERVVHELLDRFMRDLKFHQRLVAALVITPDTVDRVILAIEEEGANKLSEALNDAEVRDAMARGVNDAIVDFLRRPVTSVLGEPDDASVVDARATVTGWMLGLARDAQTRGFLVEKLRATLAGAERRTWNDLLRHIPEERLVDLLVSAARSGRARELYRDAAHRLIDGLFERRIGRLTDHLGDDAPQRVERAIATPMWDWIQRQVPTVAQRIDIAARVEQKILDFPTRLVEDLIKGVTERELQLIVRLGYVLGAGIGLMSAGISFLL